MADIVNLNRFKKQKQREAEAERADLNRVKFGESKKNKALRSAQKNLDEKNLSSHKRED